MIRLFPARLRGCVEFYETPIFLLLLPNHASSARGEAWLDFMDDASSIFAFFHVLQGRPQCLLGLFTGPSRRELVQFFPTECGQ